jgi:hypothetical protein
MHLEFSESPWNSAAAERLREIGSYRKPVWYNHVRGVLFL